MKPTNPTFDTTRDYVWCADGILPSGNVVLSHPVGATLECHPSNVEPILQHLNRTNLINEMMKKIETLNAENQRLHTMFLR